MHCDSRREPIQEFWAIHERILKSIEEDNLNDLEALAIENTACTKRLIGSGALTQGQGFDDLTALKTAVDEACVVLTEKRELISKQIVTLKRKRLCAKAYKTQRVDDPGGNL